MTFGSTTRNPNLLRPSGPSFELIQCQNDLKKEKDTNEEIRMQLMKYKKKTEECKANISTKEPVAATVKPNETLNEGHRECKDDLEMAEKNIRDLHGKLEIEDKKNQALIMALQKARNTTVTIKADLERCLEKNQDVEKDHGELFRCQQDLSMKNDEIEQMKQFEKDLKLAQEKIKELESESGESADGLKSVDAVKKDIEALVGSWHEKCKDENGYRAKCYFKYQFRRGRKITTRLVKRSCEGEKRGYLRLINKVLVSKPFCIEKRHGHPWNHFIH